MREEKLKGLRTIAIDAGGTMTDCLALLEDGSFLIGKAITNLKDESKSFISSIEDATGVPGVRLDPISACIYTGTTFINTILTRSGYKVGLLVTRGFRDLLYLQRGHSWAGYSYVDRLHSVTHMLPEPLVPTSMVREISERIGPSGGVLIPLNEQDVSRAAEELVALGCQSIAVSYLYSYINPAHERRTCDMIKEVLAKNGINIPIILASDVAPRGRELERTLSTVIQAYAAEAVRVQLKNVEKLAVIRGFRGRVYTALSYGGLVNIDHPLLYEAIISGPIGGVLGARFIGELLGEDNLVAVDMGGTSFDMGIIKGGIVHVAREPEFHRWIVSLPMVALDAVASGTGMKVSLDPFSKTIVLGPESAGHRVGVCLDYPDVTLSDCSVILGYLNPDYFLGGKVKLNREAAMKAIRERIAKPLGLDMYDAATLALDVMHARIRSALSSTILARGYTPLDYTLVCYGGGGPLHLWGIDELSFKDFVTFPFAAVFSAFGIATTDYTIRKHQGTMVAIPPDPTEKDVLKAGDVINKVWESLEKSLTDELIAHGFRKEEIKFKQFAYLRFSGQLEDQEILSPVRRVTSMEDYKALLKAFEYVYTIIYPKAALYFEAGIVIRELSLTATVPLAKPKIVKMALAGEKPPKEAYKGQREVYHLNKWFKFDLWEMDLLKAGNVIKSPAIIEHPMTTLVIPPGRTARFDEYGFVHYRVG